MEQIIKSKLKGVDVTLLIERTDDEGSEHVFLMLDQLVDRADNRKIDPSHVAKLADSIDENGLGQPLLVRSIPGEVDRYELVAGQHRREAYRLLQERHPGDARYERIECILRTDMPDDIARKLMYETNVACLYDDVLYAAEVYWALAENVSAMREENPNLAGLRTSEVVAEMATEIAGKALDLLGRAVAAGAGEEHVDALCERIAASKFAVVVASSEGFVDSSSERTCSVFEFAREIGISRDRAYELVNSAYPPPGFKVGKGYRIIRSKIDAYMDELYEMELESRRQARPSKKSMSVSAGLNLP